MASTALSMRQVSKSYLDGDDERVLISGASLDVERGEIVAVMGASGSGKSTLLSIAGGIELPTSGEVWVEGRRLDTMDAEGRAEVRRSSLGYVFQELNLLPVLSAAGNVALALELDGENPKAAREAAVTSLTSLGLSERVNDFPSTLSGGEQQRVAIARAIIGRRNLVLADEPTGALDDATGVEVLDAIVKLCHQGGAGLVATHDIRVAQRADRVVHLKNGNLSEIGVPKG